MPKTKNAPSRQETLDAMQNLYDTLTDAYWAASTIEAKDRIYGAEEVVFDIVTELQREDLEANTAAFKAAGEKVAAAMGKVEQLKQDIDKLVHAMKVAVKVAAALDKGVQLASKYFGI
ncbi:hypothetical protein LBMAG56_11220 [Verrucomicrobiota bacterium]|nr:hypothetical protein LBMAG56_11220 [Verrucomicrobiota bacterium]